MLRVWGSVLGCGGRCRDWGDVGKCIGVWGEVWKSVGEVWGNVEGGVLGCGESKGRCGENVGGVGKCVEVWGEV